MLHYEQGLWSYPSVVFLWVSVFLLKKIGLDYLQVSFYAPKFCDSPNLEHSDLKSEFFFNSSTSSFYSSSKLFTSLDVNSSFAVCNTVWNFWTLSLLFLKPQTGLEMFMLRVTPEQFSLFHLTPSHTNPFLMPLQYETS